ncbi:MAG: hypothetical protein ACD_75C02473G0002 [uncultured bacterium]|nr:MAG: hypothetical protein ACD_75C02473G0002 [uncultured bacterium]
MVDHLLGAIAHRQEDAGQIDVDHLAEIGKRHFLGHLAGFAVGGNHHGVLDNAGEGGDQVDTPHFFYGKGGQCRRVIFFGDVAGKGFDARAELLLGGCQSTFIDIGDDRLAAQLKPFVCEGHADSAASSGNNCN